MRVGTGRAVAVVVASGIAISLTVFTGGVVVPASALPTTTTTAAPAPTLHTVEPTIAPPTHEPPPPPPTHEPPPQTYEPPPTHEAPPTAQAPETTQAPAPTQAPLTTHASETTNAPAPTTAAVTTTAAAPVSTTAAAPVSTTAGAPVSTTAGAPVSTTAAAPVSTTAAAPVSTTAGAPVTTTAAAPTTQARVTTTAGPLPTGTGPLPTATGPLPTVTSSAAVSVTTSSGRTTAIGTTSGANPPTPTTAVQAGKTTTPTETPTTLEATAQNIELAKNAVPQQVKPTVASQTDIQNITVNLNAQMNFTPNPTVAPTLLVEQRSPVRQWDRSWVHVDEFYRPVIINPYPQPLQVVYVYAGAPQILIVPPLASAVAELAQIGVYSFTAMLLDAAGAATSVAVGTMYGGGYVPEPGEPPPLPPPPPVSYDNVPVQVQYTDATYQPFVVNQVVDAGMDPAVGEQKVLLDGVTPAWGVWQQNDNGQRMFVVHKTQQYPGLNDPPSQGPLPGDYQLQLASASKPAPSGLSTKDLVLIGVACLILVVGAGAIIYNVMQGRRRHPRH